MTEPAFTITVYDHSVGPEALDDAVALYRAVYAEPPYLEGASDFAAFADDLPQRAKQQSFRLVVARLDEEPLGFAMGHQLPVTTHWWHGALTALADEITTEHPGRTFAVIEIAVRRPRRRQHLGSRLHAHLTAELTEQRTTLLVRPDAVAAQAAYRSWGYETVGQIRPYAQAPVYDAKISDVKKQFVDPDQQ